MYRVFVQPATEKDVSATVSWQYVKNSRFITSVIQNAIMTLEEYLQDYASDETRKVGEFLVKKKLKLLEIKKPNSC